MKLKQQLQADLKEAMRARDERRKSVIRMALAGIVNAEMAQDDDLDEASVVAVLQKQAKQRRDTIAELKEIDRPETLAEEKQELVILEEYLPNLMSRDEIVVEARKVVDEVGATSMKDMGSVMGRLMPTLKGRADGRLVNEVVRELLSG